MWKHVLVAQSSSTLCDLTGYSPPSSFENQIFSNNIIIFFFFLITRGIRKKYTKDLIMYDFIYMKFSNRCS